MGVSRISTVVSGKIHCCFKGISRKFPRCVKEVSKVYEESFIWYAFLESFKDVSRKIEGCFEGVFSGFQGYLKEIQREFQGCFKYVSRKFQGCFKEL